LHLTVKVLYVSWRELSELDAPDGRDYVAPYLSLVGTAGAGPDASPDAVIEPPMQILPDAHVLIVEDEAAITVRYGPGQLFPDFFAAFAVNVAGFPARSGLYPVLADPVTVFAANESSGMVDRLQYYEFFDTSNELVAKRALPMRFALIDKSGFVEAAEMAGFVPVALYGDYRRSEYSEESSPIMVWILEKARHP